METDALTTLQNAWDVSIAVWASCCIRRQNLSNNKLIFKNSYQHFH